MRAYHNLRYRISERPGSGAVRQWYQACLYSTPRDWIITRITNSLAPIDVIEGLRRWRYLAVPSVGTSGIGEVAAGEVHYRAKKT